MKQIKIKFCMASIACLSLIVLSISQVFAVQNDPVGKVIAIRGNVFAVSPDLASRKLFLKAPVFLHDTVKAKQGRIQLMFKDNTLITLGRNTEMKITKYAWKPGDTDSAMETQIREGSFRIMGGAITRIAPANFKTNTPSGTIGIRGSIYAGLVKGSLLSVIFQGGKGIYVKNDAGMVNISRPGFGTRVKSSTQPPEKPSKISQQELIELENTLASTPEEESTPEPEGSENTEPSPSEPTSTENEETGSLAETTEPAEPTDGQAASSADPLAADPVPVAPQTIDNLSDISSIVQDVVLESAQIDQTSIITPTDTQQKIISMLLDLGFSGSESTIVPSSGIWVYTGKMINTIPDETQEDIKFIINWDNKRIIGIDPVSTDPDHINSGFGFGTINSTGSITNIKVLGSDNHHEYEPVMALTGYETYGNFYGSGQEGLGLAMEGYDYNIQNQTDNEFWSNIVAATVDNKTANPYSGTQTWKGFFVGIAEDMAAPNTNRRIFYNTSPDDYTLAINKDNGTFSGSMSGSDFNDANNLITGLTIGGGSSDSAYITDKTIAACLSGSDVITIDASSGGLKTYGNFMVTSGKDPLSDYTTWGYWEVAFSEPGTGKDYHIHVPGAKWICGQQTSSTVISSLIATSFSGTYTGGARGVMFDSASQMTEMTNGSTNLTIEFYSGASEPVSGNISFDEITLPVTSTTGDVTTSGFNATISSAISSSVNGTYYGPGAEAVGGNFSAKMSDGKHYHGIFAGDR